MNFLGKYALYILTGLGVIVAVWLIVGWTTMPLMWHTSALMFIAIVLHLWEEQRLPGGFTHMISEKIGFTQVNPHFGDLVLMMLVILVGLGPLFFPAVIFLQLAPLILGMAEALAHTVTILLFKMKRPYTPGMATAVFVMLPISITGIVLGYQHNLIAGLDWLWAVLFMFGSVIICQFTVVRVSGVRYRDFLKGVVGNLRNS
ncbi:HXXEE domain-containing protein [Gryllotalpicola koreensis]|uniref:HXXEE domain-containing protein n=1 Tax=Gryllotalpicola koreensis TaxID=993086 RepID=A0ABP7ZYE9_9MICO